MSLDKYDLAKRMREDPTGNRLFFNICPQFRHYCKVMHVAY